MSQHYVENIEKMNTTPERIAHAKKQAKMWRKATGRKGGFCFIGLANVYCWKNELRNPEHEEPGVLVIDECGNVWVTAGGNPYDGAERFEKIEG